MKTMLKCLKCGSIIGSKSVHDFQTCECQSIFIDGGDEYYRMGGNPEDMEFIDVAEEDV